MIQIKKKKKIHTYAFCVCALHFALPKKIAFCVTIPHDFSKIVRACIQHIFHASRPAR